MTEASSPLAARRLLLATGGLIGWSSAFALIYAVQGWGCAVALDTVRAGPTSALNALLAVIWLAHLAALAWLAHYGLGLMRAARGGPHGARFLALLTFVLALCGLAATLITGFPVLVLPPCA